MNGKHPESGQHWWPQGCDSSPICIYFYYFILRWWDLETFWSVTHNDSIYRKSGLRALVSQGQRSGTLLAVIHRCTSKGKRWVLFMRGWGVGDAEQEEKEWGCHEDSSSKFWKENVASAETRLTTLKHEQEPLIFPSFSPLLAPHRSAYG